MTTRKPKLSEVFEGSNSSLRRTFEEATYKSHFCCWEQKQPPACGLKEHTRCCLCENTKHREWNVEFQKAKRVLLKKARLLDYADRTEFDEAYDIVNKLQKRVTAILSSQSVLKDSRRRVIAEIREEVKGEVMKCVEGMKKERFPLNEKHSPIDERYERARENEIHKGGYNLALTDVLTSLEKV